ncbi:MAG TPA: ferritin-like domain-containing protein [Puia sp.]|nr:ferritin-like domain-containing protein [Puia sp.]
MQKTMEKTAGISSAGAGEQEPQLEEFFMDMLKDIYWAEKHLTKALPKMKRAATTSELQNAFEDHLAQTEGHVTRLEKAFELLGKKAQAKKCEAMDGLTKEADEMTQETEKGSMTRDVALIAAGQKVEHYEIATYGTLVQLASDMHLNEVASLLEETLKEEKAADSLLTEIAENKVNWAAIGDAKKSNGKKNGKK